MSTKRTVRGPSGGRIRTRLATASLVMSCFGATACASTGPFEPKKRTFEPGEYPAPAAPKAGSLFTASSTGLFEDDRPQSVGDVLIVRVDESDSASHDASTKLDRRSELALGFSGALQKLAPEVDLATLFGTTADADFSGGGRIQRRGEVNAMLPVRVQQVLPNGDLYVEGAKLVRIGAEERRLYVSGIVRRSDVAGDGSVPSSRIADAEIEYAGLGDVTAQQSQGWLTKLLTSVWPF